MRRFEKFPRYLVAVVPITYLYSLLDLANVLCPFDHIS